MREKKEKVGKVRRRKKPEFRNKERRTGIIISVKKLKNKNGEIRKKKSKCELKKNGRKKSKKEEKKNERELRKVKNEILK